jgi:hypothetical protein
MLWNSSKGHVTSQMDGSRGVVVSHRSADSRAAKAEARHRSVEVTGVALSQGGCEAVRAMSNVKVLCVNGDIRSSEETVFKTMCPPPTSLSHSHTQHINRAHMLLNDHAIDVCYAYIPK